MNARNPWIPRTVRVSSLLLALGLLSCLWAVVCPQAVEAANAPSGRGQVSLNGPMGVSVGAWQGSLSYTRSDLTFGCGDCAVPLGFPLSFSGQDAFERSALGFYGWRSPYDVYYVAEDRSRDVSLSGYVTFYWSMASAVRFYPTPEGGFASPPGVDDTLTSPQPGQYVLTTCSGLTYYFDSDRVPRPTRIEARNGQALVLSYNASGYVASIRDSYGRQVLLAYDGQGYLSQVTDPGATPPRTVQYSHDAAGNLTAVVDAVGNATYYSYDEQHRLTEIRDARGNTLRIVYNANGKVASLVTPLSARSFSYDLARQQTAVVDMVSGTESRRTIFHYDDRGRIVERERNDGLKLSVVWDDDDNPVRVTDEMGEVTSYTYDAEHNITSITDPLSRTLSFSYHPTFNEMTSATDALGRTMTAEYDGKGNAVRVTRPGNRVTTYEYDAKGWHMLSVTEPFSRTTRYGYDAHGNNTVITDSAGAVMTFAYDAAGRMLSFTDDNGHTTSYGYDAAGRATSVTDPLTRTTSFAYDASGNLQGVTDAAGGVRRYRYDSLNWLLGITDEVGGGITYGYDGSGNALTVADSHGHTVRYGYDGLGRLASETDPLGYKTAFEYDALGLLERREDAEGRVSTFERDAAGQLTASHYPEEDATFAYNAAGNVVAITTTQVIMRYAYNDADQVAVVTATLAAPAISKRVAYTYNDDGTRATMTDPDGGVTTYSYDGRGRIKTITNPANEVVTYSWDGAGRLTRKDLGNNTYVVYDYDEAGQLRSMVHHKAGGEVLASRAYDYDDLGNRSTEERGDGTLVDYAYDARSRLVAASYSDGTSTAYSYDLAGHRTQMKVDVLTVAYTTDAAGRLQSAGSTTYDWDRQGNLAGAVGVSSTVTYTFDSRSRLTAVVSPAAVTTTFAYYPDGRRLSRTDPDGTVTLYVYDGPNLLMELDATGSTVARFTSGYLDDWLSMERGSARYTYHADALGSVLGLSDDGGNLVEGYRYTPFGRTQVLDGAGQPLADSAVGNPFRFTGRQWLGLGELYDYRARIYDPATGRFLSEDPVDAARDPNRYAYALNNPTTFTDPTGQDTWVGAGAGATASFLFGCSRWAGYVTNQSTGEQCSITEWCCGLGAQAQLEVQSGVKTFNGDREGRSLAFSKWTVDAGFSVKAGAAQVGASVEINTNNLETYVKGGMGAYGLAAESAASTHGNVGIDAGFKLGVGFTSVRGQYCKRSVEWCEKKKEREEDEDKDTEEGECGSDTGCCWIGPDCDGDDRPACCYLCCGDGPCDEPDCGPDIPDPPPDGPGGDHPDENFSAATPLALSPGGPIYRSEPYVGLLWRGYAGSAGSMVNRAGELYEPVGVNFSPELALRLPVLVIPSGGLYGLEDLASFQTRLASYVEQGGTIISFSQQSGSEFGNLPAGPGSDRLGGYGWREDNSCFATSLYISDYHPVLSGFGKSTLNAHVDGYFATLPSGVTELLNRMKNGQPGLVLYPYPASGQGGYVLASTIYDDWGTTFYQGSQDALALVRDMISWAFEPDESLPEYSPGDSISLPITVTNSTVDHASTVELALLRPDRTTAHSQTLLMAVTAGGSVVPTLNWTLPGDSQLGIWWVEYTLRDAGGSVVQPRSAGRRLVVSDPSPITGPDRPLSMWITAPTEHYLSGTEAEFTFHVLNHTDVQRSVEIHYGLPHHTWETGDLSYGNFHDLRHSMEVGPNDTATYVYTPTIYTTDRLWSSLYEAGSLRDNAHFSVWHVSPAVSLDLQTDGEMYQPGNTVFMTVTVQNLESAPYTLDTQVQIQSSAYLVHEGSRSSPLDAEGSATLTFSYTLPVTAARGFYQVQAATFHQGAKGGEDITRFEVPFPKLQIAPLEPAAYLPDSVNAVEFRLENQGLGAVSSGTFGATLHDPAGTQIWNNSQPFALLQGQAITLTFPVAFSELFGNYVLSYQASAHGQIQKGRLDIPFANQVEPRTDQRQYSAGQTMGVDVRVYNSGHFEQNLALVRLEVPAAGYSQDRSLGPIAPGELATDTHAVSLPPTLTTGSYPFTVTLGLASGSQKQWTSSFSVPPSQLAFSTPPGVTAGEVHTVTVSNAGGSETGANYDWSLKAGTLVERVQGTIASLGVGEGAGVTFTVPAGAVSGLYYLRGPVTNTQTGKSMPVAVPLDVSGVSALLDARTDQPVYATGDPINATATITGTGAPDSGANLHLEIRAPAGGEEWITHMPGDHGPLSHPVRAMVVDGTGLKWFASYEGVAVMDDGGTPLDKADDIWQSFAYNDGLGSNDVTALGIDGDGLKWIAHWQGVSVLDDGGTPFDKSDDSWIHFDTGDQPLINGVQVIVIEGSRLVWFGTAGGVVVLDHGGTQFEKGDDLWQSYTTTDGLQGTNYVHCIAIDDMGYKWIGTYTEYEPGALNVFDDNGTPLTKGDGDRWQDYSTTDGMSNYRVNTIAIDDAGLKWVGTQSRLNVLDDKGDPFDKLDGDEWVIFELADGLPYTDVRNIVIDEAGYKWLSSYNSYSGLGALSVLDDLGTPLDKTGDVWESFTTTDGLVHGDIYALMVPGGDQVWIGTREGLNALDHGGTPTVQEDDQWQRFTANDGLVEPNVLAIAQDEAGRKWLGWGGAGLYVLDEGGTPLEKSDDVWMSFSTSDGLIDSEVYSIAPDGAGNIWIATRHGLSVLGTGGTPFDKSDDLWQSWDADDDYVFQIVYAVAVDEQGYTWIGGASGAAVLDVGGTPFDKIDDVWQIFTEDDGLPYDEIRAIVIDEAGYKWLGIAWDGAYVLDDGGTPFEKGDDDLQWFPAGDGYVTDITIDGEGYKWLVTTGGAEAVDDGGTPMSTSDDQYESYWLGDGLANRIVAVAADEGGDIWFGTGEGVYVLDHSGTPFDQGDDVWRVLTTTHGLADDDIHEVAVYGDVKYLCPWWGGIQVRAKGSRLLWEGDEATGLVGVTQILSPVGVLDHVGKLTLHGVLTSTTNQVIARDTYPFYIFDTDTVLTLETDKPFYRPGETMALSGEVRNEGGAPLSDQTLTIVQDGTNVYDEGPFDVPAGGSHPYSGSTVAPGSPGTTRLEASVDGVTIEDEVPVIQPQVEAALQATDLVGSQPFTVTVVLTNVGEIEASVHVEIQGGGETAVIPAGETRLVQRAVQTSGDTTVNAVLSGDLDQTLSRDVTFGEAAEATFHPAPIYCPGVVEIPYALTNTGQLEAEFTTLITLTGSLVPISGLQIDSYLPVSATQEGALAVELAADDYVLNWRHPYGSGQVDVAVPAVDQLTLEATAGPSDGYRAPVTVTLTNVGCNPFSGTLSVEGMTASGPFFSDREPVDVELDGSGIYTFALDTEGLAPGVYTATLALGDGSGQTVGTASVSDELPGPDLSISALPAQTTLVASQTVTLTFGVENLGASGDQAHLIFTLDDFEDETQVGWLGAGGTGTFTYTFFVPPDLVTGDLLATYVLTGSLDSSQEAGEMLFEVEGISLTVSAEADQAAYREGDPAIVTLSVDNVGGIDTGPLEALVTYNGFTQTQSFELASGAGVVLDFPLVASFTGDAKVFYGVFYAGTDRSLHLNTLYLRQQQPLATLLTDKQVYQPGETVHATLVTTLTQGTLSVFAPGYDSTLAIADGASVSFDLPAPMARGTEAIYYTADGTGTPEDGRERMVPFDVDGPEVFVRTTAFRVEPQATGGAALLGEGQPDTGDTVTLDLVVSSDRTVDLLMESYILYPDGSPGQADSQPVHLEAVPDNHIAATALLTGTQMGAHQFQYELILETGAGSELLVKSSVGFDTGPAGIIRLTTDQDSYPDTSDPVEATLEIYSRAGGPAQLTLTPDEGPDTGLATTLSAGYQTLTLFLNGPIPAGRRLLAASLEMDGHAAGARTRFNYGTSLPDLRPGAPWVAAGGTLTRTLTALVSNEGQSPAASSTVRFYDGSVPLGTATLPALDGGEGATASVVWDIQGQGGEHALRVSVDPVAEFDTGNNEAQAAVTLPRLDTGLSVTPARIEAGGVVMATVRLENLQAAAELPVTATLEIRSPLGTLVHDETWTRSLEGTEEVSLGTTWLSGQDAEEGSYSVLQEAWDAHGESYLNRSSFTVGPFDYAYIYLPLVLRDHSP